MAELLSPTVVIEELASANQVIQAVSTSNLGIVGFTQRGPTDKATLVTSFEQFTEIFGGMVRESFMPISMVGYFQNGGRRAYVVRVVPSDAVAADAKVQSIDTDRQIYTGDGALLILNAVSTGLLVNSGASPLAAGLTTLRYRKAGTPVVAAAAKKRDGTTTLLTAALQLKYEGRVVGLPTFDAALDSIVPGTLVLTFLSGAVPKTIDFTIAAPPINISTPIATETNAAGSSLTVDLRSGRFTLTINVAETPDALGAVTVSFTPASATITITSAATIVANQLGLLGASLTAGGGIAAGSFVNVATGALSLDFIATNQPHNVGRLLATYTTNLWDLDPISKGAWADEALRVDIAGSLDFFTAATASYSRANVRVLLQNVDTLAFETKESYDEIVFDDVNNTQYFADVINDMSDLITVNEPGGLAFPLQLNGVARTVRIAAGDEGVTTALTLTSDPLSCNLLLPHATIAKRTVSITYTSSADSLVKTITDDGNGNLIGGVDAAYVTSLTIGSETLAANTISYTTGAFNFKVPAAQPIKVGTLVTAVYYSAPAETVHQELFGDTAKGYTAGSDGTFTSGTYGRNQFSNAATLSATFKGMFALSRVDDIMQVVIPDFAGDTTVSLDQLDYADARANQAPGADRFIILTVPLGSDAQEAVDWFRFTLNRYSKYAALYAPWVNVADPLSDNRSITIPPIAHIAGIYARTDNNRNVSKAPAGITDGALKGILSLETEFTQGERDLLAPNKINSLISSPQTGLAVWGARTIALESEWRYVNARRLFMFLSKSIYNSTFWAVFENNGPALWTRLKSQLDGFMVGLFNQDYFGGTSPSDSFKVICDSSNNTEVTIANGQVIVSVKAKPKTPAEWIRIQLAQLSLTQ